ncbi:Hypothetical predicted protein [Pelobates cultripes]|uniref:Centrosomal protein of 55 kDa n=1 Tax=Pelobates cultripes TaxID=61616 RepID=A0AAD1TBD8_PELCU|nr:Hypothetical predicted protein [Pelobates cultripes]
MPESTGPLSLAENTLLTLSDHEQGPAREPGSRIYVFVLPIVKMNTKILSNKLGIKTGPTKPDPEMEKLKKENAALKKTLDEMSKSKGKMSDVEKKKLLEKILELETLKVKNAQEITKQYQEIENLKHALKSKLNDQVSTAETDAKTMANLAQGLRNPAPAITTSQQNPQKMTNEGADANMDILQVQLKDALEKNQQWLSYDQQRETYVQGLMARIYELEQQVAAVNQTLQQQVKESSSDAKQDDKQKYYDKLLLTAKKDLEEEQKLVAQLNAELATTRTKYEEKKKEVGELSVSVQLVREDEKQLREDERRRVKDKIQRLKIELELCRNKVVEEKNRSSELLNQVQAMQQSLLKNEEDEKRVISLEQQIQRCTSDFENEKIDRQKVQHQLHKVLKELRKAREQITRLEPTKILELETLKVKNAQEITKQYQEIENLKHALKSKLNDQVSTAETDAKTMANLAQGLRNPAPAITTSQQNPQKMTNEGADANMDILQVQLKDALEKNQQWLSYDQQRETYVQGLMARIYELEQQVAAVNQTLQQQVKESSSDAKQDDKQKYYDKLLLTAKKDLEEEQKLVAQLNAELATTRTKYEEKKKEVGELSVSVQLVREDEKQLREDERRRVKDKIQRLKIELELCRNKVVEEKNRSSELLNQVQAMQQSLLKNEEDEKRVISLEQQIQRCTSDFENEKIDRQKVQHQLHKVLKELRKAREQITRLEPTKHLHEVCYIDSSKNFHTEFDEKLSMREQYPSPKHRSPLDESFLECPKCKAIYPTSEHRELLAHIDYCTS